MKTSCTAAMSTTKFREKTARRRKIKRGCPGVHMREKRGSHRPTKRRYIVYKDGKKRNIVYRVYTAHDLSYTITIVHPILYTFTTIF